MTRERAITVVRDRVYALDNDGADPGLRRAVDYLDKNECWEEPKAEPDTVKTALVSSLERMLAVYEALMPGVGFIAVKNYRELNEAPIAARAALDAAKVK